MVLPVYNEEGNILQVIEKILQVLPGETRDFEIILVDDGSTDKTAGILEKLKALDTQIKIIRHPRNRGYGASLRSGFQKAEKELIFMMDADQQFDILDIKRLVTFIEDYDIVIGSREKRRDSFYRSLFSSCFNFIVKFLFKIRFQDINCGFKLFKREALQKMTLISTGGIISAEILMKASLQKLKIRQVPVNHYPRIYGQQTGASLRVILTILWEIGMLKLWMVKSSFQ